MAIILRRRTTVQSLKAIVCHFTSWSLLMFFEKKVASVLDVFGF